MPEDPDDWPPGTDGLVATMLRQQKAPFGNRGGDCYRLTVEPVAS